MGSSILKVLTVFPIPETPIPGDLQIPILIDRILSRLNFPDPTEHTASRHSPRPHQDQLSDPFAVQLGLYIRILQDRLDLRREQ